MNVFIYFLIFSAIVVLIAVGGALCEGAELFKTSCAASASRFSDGICRVLMLPAAFVYCLGVCAFVRGDFSFSKAVGLLKEILRSSERTGAKSAFPASGGVKGGPKNY